jgi:hypothetical protein
MSQKVAQIGLDFLSERSVSGAANELGHEPQPPHALTRPRFAYVCCEPPIPQMSSDAVVGSEQSIYESANSVGAVVLINRSSRKE